MTMKTRYGKTERRQEDGARPTSPGNGLSRTAMVFRIAAVGETRLTVPQLNKIKTVNPRSLERVYAEVLRQNDRDGARFALSLILK